MAAADLHYVIFGVLLTWCLYYIIILVCRWQAAMATADSESYQARKAAAKAADDLEAARDTISVMQCQIASSDDVAAKVPPAFCSKNPGYQNLSPAKMKLLVWRCLPGFNNMEIPIGCLEPLSVNSECMCGSKHKN